MKTHHCTFEGCPKISQSPGKDGWTFISKWGPGITDGAYCPEHAAALEAVLVSGEIDEIQKGSTKPGKR